MTSRQQAKRLHLTTYIGATCNRGHESAERYVHNGACIQCAQALRQPRSEQDKATRRTWKAANRDKLAAERRRNRDKRAAVVTHYRAIREAQDERVRQALAWLRPLVDVIGEAALAFKQDTAMLRRQIALRESRRKAEEAKQLTPQQRSALTRRRKEARKQKDEAGYREYLRLKKQARIARERKGGKQPSHDERMRLLHEQAYVCAYCEAGQQLELDHKVAVLHGGSNAIWNRQYLCQQCNSRKGATSDDDYREAIGLPAVL